MAVSMVGRRADVGSCGSGVDGERTQGRAGVPLPPAWPFIRVRNLGCASRQKSGWLLLRRGVTAAAVATSVANQPATGDATRWSGGVSIAFLRPERDRDEPSGVI